MICCVPTCTFCARKNIYKSRSEWSIITFHLCPGRFLQQSNNTPRSVQAIINPEVCKQLMIGNDLLWCTTLRHVSKWCCSQTWKWGAPHDQKKVECNFSQNSRPKRVAWKPTRIGSSRPTVQHCPSYLVIEARCLADHSGRETTTFISMHKCLKFLQIKQAGHCNQHN